jgi:hypothetical protein
MCDFFSFLSDGQGHLYYFDWTLREKMLCGELGKADSHSSIATQFRLNEDRCNKCIP